MAIDNDMNIDKILERLMEHYGFKRKSKLLELLQIKRTTFYQNVNSSKKDTDKIRKTSPMIYEVILKLCLREKLNPNWVFFGQGAIKQNTKIASIVHNSELNTLQSSNTISIPYFSDINASDDFDYENDNLNTMEYLVLPKTDNLKFETLQAINVYDDSMMPNIPSNSIIIIETSNILFINNAVYVVVYNGKKFVTRVQQIDDKTLLLKSDNAQCSTLVAKIQDVHFCGKVINNILMSNIT